MTTVDDFAQGMLREYSAFAGRCAALVAEHGDEEAAAELYSIDDLPQIAEQLRAFRVRAEAAEAEVARLRAELAQARADAGVLAVAARAADDCGWLDQMRRAGLTKAEVDALDALYNRLADLPDAEMVAAIRRALGCAQ